MTAYMAQLNGHAATAADLAPTSFAGYAHFTAMQVRGNAIKGLDLHLNRLQNASLKLFERTLPEETTRDRLRDALPAAPADLSLIATVYSPEGEFTASGVDADPNILVRTGPPASGPRGPLSLNLVEHERMVPDVKHVGEIAKTYYLREAAAAGFDDVAFTDRDGRLSEASIWNLVFWDGNSVVWPQADMLIGTTMGVVRRQLEGLGVPQRERVITRADLFEYSGAAVMNSWTPGVEVNRIADASPPKSSELTELLHRAWREEPFVAI